MSDLPTLCEHGTRVREVACLVCAAEEEVARERARAQIEKHKAKIRERQARPFLHRLFPWRITITRR